MSGVKLIAPHERKFEQIGGEAGDIQVGRDVASDISATFGAGVVVFKNCSMEWTVLYDEYFYCLEGTLTIKTKEGNFVMRPGYGLWLPKGTWLIYETKEPAKVVFTIYPVDWRERQAKA
jgi:ethanolamine utilization protein EutQ (cupin superfamily)